MSDIVEINDSAPVMVRSKAIAYFEMTKPRIAGMVLVVTALGFYLALPAAPSISTLWLLFHTVLGTALIGSGANALNMCIEAELDALMDRTKGRPLPSGRLSMQEGWYFSAICSVLGVVYLALFVNILTSMFGLLALVSYALIYTPMKRHTYFCVFAGAIPGALPPVMGWAGATGDISVMTWLLFGIMFFWQIPHFAAIAWLYREDYKAGGYPMLPVVDPDGIRTSLHMITLTVALITVSILPAIHGLAGPIYAVGAMVLGVLFLAFGLLFVMRQSKETARLHLLASITYLPLLFTLMVVDKNPF